ncbi:hypothetical protein WJX77_003151 [Trebouxia sp. C0004]
MSDWTEDQDPYEVLGLTQGHESTGAQIKKAYRLLALKKHPDKQPNNPNAATEFHPIQRAFDLLSDAKARAALDDLYKAKAARKAREAGQSEKRRKMREDLEKREGAYQTARNDEQRARNKLKEELNRLRQKEIERRANHAAEVSLTFAQATAQSHQQQQYQAGASASAAEYQPAAPPQITQELLRTLKVTWDKHSSSYFVDELKHIMGKHGAVEDIVLVESKKRKKGSALVVMQSLEAAQAAAEAVNGSLRNPLLVVPLAKAAGPSNADSNGTQDQSRALPESYAPEQPQQQPQPTPAFPLSQSATPPTPPSSPMKPIPVRNPFGGSFTTNQTAAPAPAAASSTQMPASAAAAVPKPLFAAAAPNSAFAAALPQPLFAVGTSMSINAAGHMPAGPFGFSAGSYSSFPGPPSSAADHAQTNFGQNSFAYTVQAGVKRAFEDATLLKLKQAADQARAIQQLQTEQPDQ